MLNERIHFSNHSSSLSGAGASITGDSIVTVHLTALTSNSPTVRMRDSMGLQVAQSLYDQFLIRLSTR